MGCSNWRRDRLYARVVSNTRVSPPTWYALNTGNAFVNARSSTAHPSEAPPPMMSLSATATPVRRASARPVANPVSGPPIDAGRVRAHENQHDAVVEPGRDNQVRRLHRVVDE